MKSKLTLIGLVLMSVSAVTAKADYNQWYEQPTSVGYGISGVYVAHHVVNPLVWADAFYAYCPATRSWYKPYTDANGGPHGFYARKWVWAAPGSNPPPTGKYNGPVNSDGEPSHVNIWTEQYPNHWVVYKAYTPYSQGDIFISFTPGGRIGYTTPPISQNIYAPPAQGGTGGSYIPPTPTFVQMGPQPDAVDLVTLIVEKVLALITG